MSLRSAELSQIVGELSARLPGARLQKVFAPEPGLCFFELRLRGATALLRVSAGRDGGRISIASSRPHSPAAAAPFQQHLRRELVGAALVRVTMEAERIVELDWARGGCSRRLVADFDAREAKLLLLDEGGRALAISSEVDLSASNLKVGDLYRRLPSRVSAESLPSRLRPIEGAAFPFAEAADALCAEEDQQQRAEAIRRERRRRLKKTIDRLSRTREKVLAEAARQPEAERHRRMGELISQNLNRLKRGFASARVIEYTEHGPIEVEVPLQEDRTPKQQAEWHFHQYRRLLRGSERASERLAQLDAEVEQARAELARWQAAGLEEVLELEPPARASPRPRKAPPRSRPYKEYFSAQGERIWVGRDSRSNDELTFHLAQPEDLWLHARGASGSHVLIPMQKNAELSPELLIDAAHLALHHSGLKGEPRGEVIYVKAKHVRRRKGDPLGTAHVEREKSLMVRVEPQRLTRLLATRGKSRAD